MPGCTERRGADDRAEAEARAAGAAVPGRKVLAIDVSSEQLLQWRDWAMPVEQPFVMRHDDASRLGLTDDPGRLTQEWQGTFELYGVDDLVMCWLTQEQARSLPPTIRAEQPARHLWRRRGDDDASTTRADVDRIVRYVVEGRRNSRHEQISDTQWNAVTRLWPDARRLAGTFPPGSGPNCFATVMAAAGVPGAEHVWMQREPIEAWLAEHTVALAKKTTDDSLGTVYVWRRENGLIDHAAIALGQGLALHKPSDGWMSPTKVLTTRELMASARSPGRRLTRHRRI